MFFLMKCAFWLALVYAAILYGVGPMGHVSTGAVSTGAMSSDPVATGLVSPDVGHRQLVRDATRAGEAAIGSVLGSAASGVTSLCASRPAECLADATRLKALFDASAGVEPVARDPGGSKRHGGTEKKAPSASNPEPAEATIPMPVADPRRQGSAFEADVEVVSL